MCHDPARHRAHASHPWAWPWRMGMACRAGPIYFSRVCVCESVCVRLQVLLMLSPQKPKQISITTISQVLSYMYNSEPGYTVTVVKHETDKQ